jgi:poly(beta-D-mannuronate) lyase
MIFSRPNILFALVLLATLPGAAAHAAGCAPVPPIQRDINTQKAYRDSHGSDRDTSIFEGNKADLANLYAFLTLVEGDADAYVGHGDRAAQACAMQAIDNWARSGALLGTMSYHGYLDRMAAAGSIGLTLIKLHAPLGPSTRQWLATICADAKQESEAHTAGFGVNNLAYWGAMDVGACGLALGDAGDWQFARQGLREGLDNIRDDGTLERELGRRARATHYHEYGAQPLVVLARLSAWKGEPLGAQDRARLSKLVNLVVTAVQHPQLLASAAGTSQKAIRMPGWLPLWNGPPPTPDGHDSIYIRLGGDTAVLNTVLSRAR